MDNLGSLLGIRRVDKLPNARMSHLFGVTKDVDEILMVFSEGSGMWRKWRMTELLRGAM